MRCFTITETAQPWLRVRSQTTVGPPRPCLTVGSPAGWTNIPLDRELLGAFTWAAEEGLEEPGGGLNLLNAGLDMRYGACLTPEYRRGTGHALVHVATASGVDGALRYEAQAYDERVERRQVVKAYKPFPPAGIDVIATGMGPGGETEPHGLIVMAPKSSFRLVRTGDIDDASPVLIVRWTGRNLYCEPPRWAQRSQPRQPASLRA